MIKDSATLTPQTAPPASRPAERIPILIEITEEDRQNAKSYTDCNNCLVGTALKRMGYQRIVVLPSAVYFLLDDGEHQYESNDLGVDNLGWNVSNQTYSPEVVGKQIILYPV